MLCHCCGQNSNFSPLWEEAALCNRCQSYSYTGDPKIPAAELYDAHYFTDGEYTNYVQHAPVHRLNFQRKLKLIQRKISWPIQSVLDYGCAYGYFLDTLRENSISRVSGLEVSPACVKSCQERGLAVSPVKDNGNGFEVPAHCDLITLWDVFEHLREPSLVLEKLANSQTKGGVIALTTVDSSAWVPRLRKTSWRQYHPPTHLHYPTRKAFPLLFQKLGYGILYLSSFGYYRAVETYLPKLTLKPFGQLPLYLNLFDTQFVLAIKR